MGLVWAKIRDSAGDAILEGIGGVGCQVPGEKERTPDT
jgi:hypothetical protein